MAAHRKSPAQIEREINAFLVEQEEQASYGPTGKWKVTHRVGSQKDADETAAWVRRHGGSARVRRSHMTKMGDVRIGQQFERLGQTFEVTRVGRDRQRTIQLARRSRDGFGKDVMIDHRSIPLADFAREHLRPIANKRSHMTKADHGTVPTFKISKTDPATMTASAINKELDKLDEQDSTLGDLMIAAGRGYERPSEYLKMTDPLSMELRKNSDRRADLRIEVDRRYGTLNPPRRLPSGRGYGPRRRAGDE